MRKMLVLSGLVLFFVLSGSTLYSQDQIIDIDNNIYKTVTIGSSIWLAENLKTTKFNDGTPILLESNNIIWASLIAPGYCWYNNDSIGNKNMYGALYNWYAAKTGNLCPQGWHVSTHEDWKEVFTFLGGEVFSGGKLKETGYDHWNSPNSGADNSSGFTALPGGYRDIMGGYDLMGSCGVWWSIWSKKCLKVQLYDFGAGVNNSWSDRSAGNSIRCVKDKENDNLSKEKK